MARKRKPRQVSSGADWMDTYTDMVSLLLTFFVLLFSLSTLDAEKWEQFAATYAGAPLAVVAPLNPGRSIAPDPQEEEVDPPTEEQLAEMEADALSKSEFHGLLDRINALVWEKGLEDSLLVEATGNQILLRFPDSLLFDSGRHTLREESLEIVDEVMVIIEDAQEWILQINIEGHTDDVPVRIGTMYRNNWDLSVMRAATVASYFDEHSSIDPTKLKPSGNGETVPVDTNDTEEGRARNRRVDVTIHRAVFEVTYNPRIVEPATADPSSVRTEELWFDGM